MNYHITVQMQMVNLHLILRQNRSFYTPTDAVQTISNVRAPSLSLSSTGIGTVNINDSWMGQLTSIKISPGAGRTTKGFIKNATFFAAGSQYWGTSGAGDKDVTIENLRGLHLKAPNALDGIKISNNYGIYQDWTKASNYFAGNVGIGTTIATNRVGAGNTAKLAVGILTAHHVFANRYHGDEKGNFYGGKNAGSGAVGIASGAFDNIGIGESSGAKITSGYGNLLLGTTSGCEITTGSVNTIVGCNGMRQLTTGRGNIAIGIKPAPNQQTGEFNIYMGLFTGMGKTDGKYNVEIGDNAGRAIAGGNPGSSGCSNVFLGHAAGMNMYYPDGDVHSFNSNTYIGKSAGFFQLYDNASEVKRNIFIGECTGHTFNSRQVPNYDRPVDNVVIGSLAGRCNSGAHNVFLGSYVNNRAGIAYTHSAGCFNVGIGHSVCLAKHQGDRQLAIGHSDYQWIIGDCDLSLIHI